MNYKKHYDLLIENAIKRPILDNIEKHHIIPRCIGGSNDKINLAPLTPREHYMAHYLLHKIHPSHRGLLYAIYMMMNLKRKDMTIKISSREYEKIKKQFKIIHSKRMIGENNPSKRKDVREKQSKAGKGRVFTKEHRDNLSKAKKGSVRTIESRKKQSDAISGSKNHFYGKTHTPEAKQQIGEKSKNRIIPRECKVKSLKKIMVDGKEYACITEYCDLFGVKKTCMTYRLKSKSKKFKNYKYI